MLASGSASTRTRSNMKKPINFVVHLRTPNGGTRSETFENKYFEIDDNRVLWIANRSGDPVAVHNDGEWVSVYV